MHDLNNILVIIITINHCTIVIILSCKNLYLSFSFFYIIAIGIILSIPFVYHIYLDNLVKYGIQIIKNIIIHANIKITNLIISIV